MVFSFVFFFLRWAVVLGLVVYVGLAVRIQSSSHTSPTQAPSPSLKEDSPFLVSTLRKRLPKEAFDRIQAKLNLFEHQQRIRLTNSLVRSTRYIKIYRRIFRERGMPEELAYLPIIESGFYEQALSPAKAAGVWQFIPETGKRYALNQNAWTDRRLDPIQSAKAAAALLQKMHQQFGSWELALASYNGGAGLIRWARRKNQRASLPTHYWALDLPEETQHYVPAFIAAALIAKNPAAFGFVDLPFEPQIHFELLDVSPGVSLGVLAQRLDIKHTLLTQLNPHLLQGRTPPNSTPHTLRVPKGLKAKLNHTQPNNVAWRKYKAHKTKWMLHPVSEEDTVQALSTRFQTPFEKILKINRLENDQELRERPYVMIPVNAADAFQENL